MGFNIGGDATPPLLEGRCNVFGGHKKWGTLGGEKSEHLSQYNNFIGIRDYIRGLLEML